MEKSIKMGWNNERVKVFLNFFIVQKYRKDIDKFQIVKLGIDDKVLRLIV